MNKLTYILLLVQQKAMVSKMRRTKQTRKTNTMAVFAASPINYRKNKENLHRHAPGPLL